MLLRSPPRIPNRRLRIRHIRLRLKHPLQIHPSKKRISLNHKANRLTRRHPILASSISSPLVNKPNLNRQSISASKLTNNKANLRKAPAGRNHESISDTVASYPCQIIAKSICVRITRH